MEVGKGPHRVTAQSRMEMSQRIPTNEQVFINSSPKFGVGEEGGAVSSRSDVVS